MYIEDWYDLDDVRNNMSGTHTLLADLDSSTPGYAGIGDSFVPLGLDVGEDFTGDLNGANHSILDLEIQVSEAHNTGLFATNDGFIEDLHVDGTIANTVDDFYGIGSIAGDNIGTILYCSSSASVSSGTDSTAGGIVGYAQGPMTGCSFYGSVDADGTSEGGGMAGRMTSGGDFDKCFNSGSINAGANVGGLVGRNTGVITESYNVGDVTGTDNVGGVVGYNSNDQTPDCNSYSSGAVTATDTNGGGFSGYDSANTYGTCYWDTEASGQSTTGGSATGLSTSEMQGSSASTNMSDLPIGTIFSTVESTNEQFGSDGYPILHPDGDGTEETIDIRNQVVGQGVLFSYIDVSTWDELQNISNDLYARYRLVNDLDSSSSGYSGTGDSFTPIGFDGGTYTEIFKGHLDGNGYEIRDIVIEIDQDADVGLFPSTASGKGVVENLYLEGSITNLYSNGNYLAGGIAGYNRGSRIENCVVDVDINVDGSASAGGIAGLSASDVIDCIYLGDISAEIATVGGVVGEYTGNDSVYRNIASTGSVYGNMAGGVIGKSAGPIRNGYSIASVDSIDTSGGFVGQHNSDDIINSYAAGSVTSDDVANGFTGVEYDSTPTAIDSYWDTEATGQTSTASDATPLTTSEMQGDSASTNMDGFDFTNDWSEVLESDEYSTGDGYPIIQSISEKVQLESQGLYVPFEIDINGNGVTGVVINNSDSTSIYINGTKM